MTYSLGLEASKKLKEFIGKVDTREYYLESRLSSFLAVKIPSPNLSELAYIFKMIGDKKGWREEGEQIGGFSSIERYLQLCELWATTQSQEKCDEFIINLLTNE